MKFKSIHLILGLGLLVLASVVIWQDAFSTPALEEAVPTTNTAADLSVGEVLVFKVEGMTCGACEEKITKALKAQSGVGRVVVKVAQGLVAVESLSEANGALALARVVTDAGFPATFTGKLKTMPSAAGGKSKGGCGSGCCS